VTNTDKSQNVGKLAYTISTLGPVGFLPIAPGTWGSLVAVVIWWFFLAEQTLVFNLTIIAILALVAVLLCELAEKHIHKTDPGEIVIDEVIGQWITLLFCPHNLLFAFIGFILFRLFDVLKPFPVGISQKLHGGWGIVIDDILAGIYGLLVVVLLTRMIS